MLPVDVLDQDQRCTTIGHLSEIEVGLSPKDLSHGVRCAQSAFHHDGEGRPPPRDSRVRPMKSVCAGSMQQRETAWNGTRARFAATSTGSFRTCLVFSGSSCTSGVWTHDELGRRAARHACRVVLASPGYRCSDFVSFYFWWVFWETLTTGDLQVRLRYVRREVGPTWRNPGIARGSGQNGRRRMGCHPRRT